MSPEEIREEVHRLLDLESRSVKRNEKWKLASLAFTLAQQAEVLSRAQQPESAPAVLDKNQSAIADSIILLFAEQFRAEKDATRRKLYQRLILFEERWYGIREERLRRLLRDCGF